MAKPVTPGSALPRRQMLMLAPLAIAGAAGGGFWAMLSRMGTGRFDPHDVHAPSTGRMVPPFDLPSQAPGAGFSSGLLRSRQQPVLVNFFASWCIPCVLEAQLLATLATTLAVWGIAYKDAPENAQGFVSRTGNPYGRLASDRDGLAAIDWGVSGVPESFLIAPGGVIRWHLAGPLTAEIIQGELRPILHGLKR